MHKLHKIKDMLMEELEKYGDEKELSAGSLAVIDTLTHSIKNLCKIIDEGDDYSERRYYMADRKRDSRGRYSRDERMNDYSRAADEIIGQLETMVHVAPDEKTKRDIRDLIHKMETA